MPLRFDDGQNKEKDTSKWALRGVKVIAGSPSLQSISVGLLFILIGYLIQTGPLAAFFPLWGAGAIITGGVAHIVIRRKQ